MPQDSGPIKQSAEQQPQSPPSEPKKTNHNLIYAILGGVIVLLLAVIGFLAMQTGNTTTPVETTPMEPRTKTPSPTNTPIPTAASQPNSNNCDEGYTFFDNEFFSVCYPDFMTTSSRTYQTPADVPPRDAISTEFKNEIYEIKITTAFTGGWGGGACFVETTETDALKYTKVYWDQEGSSDGCTNNLTSLVATINKDRTGNFPVAVQMSRLDEEYLDKDVFEYILGTLEVK